eukprot:scaffold41642_cov52-Attheya_sp.AAC.1
MASPDNSSDSTAPQRPSQAVYFPAFTWDYYLKNDEKWDIGIVARRCNIKKGSLKSFKEESYKSSIDFARDA